MCAVRTRHTLSFVLLLGAYPTKMPKDFARTERIAAQMQRELAQLIRFELKDPRIGLVTLTEVSVTPDLAHAKVFFTCLEEGEALEVVLAGLRRSSGFLRREVGRRIRMHALPELHFHYDASVREGARLSRLIDETLAEEARLRPAQPSEPDEPSAS
jgi:ribosome-binding factor A